MNNTMSTNSEPVKIRIRTYDEEWIDSLQTRIEKALDPELRELDMINEEYLITITIEKLP